jgi:hypothetical protein
MEGQATLEVGARTYRLIGTGDFTLDEWCDVKVEMEMNPGEFEAALRQLDPRAWRKLIVASIRRAEGRDPDRETLDAIGKVNLLAAITGLKTDASPEVDAADVPPGPTSGASGNGDSGMTSDGESATSATPSFESAGAPVG